VLAEYVDDVFETRSGEESPYMLLVAPVRKSWRTPLTTADRERLRDPDLRVRVSVPRSRIPAVTHVDYSARIQTVDPERHGRFYRMMRAFYELTGCPVIVNTSFNVRGEPIVCTPDEAFRCFMSTHLDVLVLGDYLLVKEAQPGRLRRDAAEYVAQYEPD
jgi:carbamoyltransferase